MKVLYVIDSLTPGGTERSTVTLLPWLRQLDVESTIAIFRTGDNDLRHEAAAAGATVELLSATGPLGRCGELRRLIRSVGPDVVHTALYEADQLGRVAALGTGVPVISSFVSTPYDNHRLADPNVRRWKLRLAQLIDAVTARLAVTRFHAVSEGARDQNCAALHIEPDRVTVAERGRSTDQLGDCTAARREQIRRSLGIDADTPIVLNLGRLDEQKGQLVLLDAMVELLTRQPDAQLLVAGKDGSAATRIRDQLAAGPGLDAHVRLLGHRTDIGALLCAADVLAISSHFEGTAGAAIEAMAVGTPVVSTDISGARGVLRHDENSILTPVGDANALAQGLGRVLDDPTLAARLSAQGHTDFVGRFTMEAAAARLRSLYDSVARPPR